MDTLKRQRTPIRASFTRMCQQITTEFDNITLPERFKELLDLLSDKHDRLESIESQILTALTRDKTIEDDALNEEYITIESYREKYISIKRQLTDGIERQRGESSSANNNTDSIPSNTIDTQKKYRLPELELNKFGGNIKEWLTFWGQFQKIHDDKEIAPEDKFQYLSQSMVTGSRPKEIVNSYPANATSYFKAIEALKSRYGRDDVLIDVYIRELLKLINGKKRMSDLSQLYDKIETQLRALETLGVVNNQYAIMLFPMVESCLPEDTIKAWERQRNLFRLHAEPNEDQSNLQLLMNFLKHEVESEERVKLARNTFESRGSNENNTPKSGKQIATAADLLNSSNNGQRRKQCLFCDKGHPSHECFEARRMTLEEKRAIITKKGACFSCLNLGHSSKNCKAMIKCMLCEKKHQTIMCNLFSSNKKNKENKIEKKTPDDSTSLANTNNVTQNVLLQTIRVKVTGSNGRNRLARALIDTGSQRSYITNTMAQEMGYKVNRCETLKHGLFGGHVSVPREHREYEVHLANPNNEYRCHFKVLDNPEICKYATSIPRGAWITELENKNIKLSDYGHTSKTIEILIGADVAGKLFTGNIQPLDSGPVAIETKLGWTLIGKVTDDGAQHTITDSLLVTSLFVHDCTIQDLWKLDVIGITDKATKVEKEELAKDTSKHFLKTVKRKHDGRYQVDLPWVEEHPPLPDNHNIAVKRLQNTTKKLKDGHNFDDYNKVFDSWKQEGIIEEIKPETIENKCHYLPHRAVIKDGSSTKIRPVFDASARRDNHSPSLNDCLSKGPNLIELIPKILMQFRERKIGVSADIKAAFLQISVNESDRDYLRFLWWKDADCKEIQLLRHTRVVFGVASSPFLLAATINYHLDNAPKHLEKTAKQLRNAFYVDNCLTSLDDEKALAKFISESADIMKTAQFELRRWEYSGQFSEESRKTMVLGLVWDKSEDSLSCDTEKIIEEFSGPINKRCLLSTTHKIFDPIGFTCPITIPPKLLLQKTWELKLNWNEDLPPEMSNKFVQWKEELSLLSRIKIPRRLNLGEGDITLHTFCDASKNAYACCIFLRNETSSQTVTIDFVQAKNRITPLKDITIPRLELLSCLIGARLTNEVNQTLQVPKEKIFFWSDSTTALSWIAREDQWGAYVWNRVSEIRELTVGSTWRHIPGTHNPADLPSRGVGVKQFIKTRWWEGPEWLKSDVFTWPTIEQKIDEHEVNSEKRKTVKVNLTTSQTLGSQILSARFSKFKTMLKVVAWMKRFIHNCNNPATKTRGELCVTEIQDAELHIVRLIQHEAFTPDQIKSMKNVHLEKTETGLLTVKSRLTARQDTDMFKSPALLPSRHDIVEKIILDAHQGLSHAGVNITLSQLREKYWILRGRKTVSRVISRCQRCRRFTAKPMTSNPPALPADRVNDAAVFEISGVDLAGPLYLKGGRKAWIVVFTCAVYRAVHLELITSLSTEAFLQALERFISRRGRPRTIYSDNATNFVGANNLLNFDKEVIQATILQRIEWKFIPPLSPWWGGWWERMIRIIKNMLRRVLGKSILKYEEMNTILCNIEAIVNSRPLTYLSEDTNDYQALTPALFLNEIPSNQVIDTELINQKSLSKRYNFKIKLLKDLKQRFRREYLSELMQFSSQKNSPTIQKGDLVFVNNDTKRLQWPLARVLDVFPGKDGFSRVAKLKTQSGEFLRSIQRLHPVEIREQQEAGTLVTRSGRRSRKPDKLNIVH